MLSSAPVHLVYAPAYILGSFSASILAGKEEEAVAQYKVIFGGLGCVVCSLMAGWRYWQAFASRFLSNTSLKILFIRIADEANGFVIRTTSNMPPRFQISFSGLVDSCKSILKKAVDLITQDRSINGRILNIIGTMAFVWIITRWHLSIIDGS